VSYHARLLRWALTALAVASVALVAVALAGGLGSPAKAPLPAAITTAPTANPASSPELEPATHPQCAQLGAAVLAYLRTGADPTLDRYAELRAQILAEPADAQPGLRRHGADNAIELCDRDADAAAAATSASVSAAASSASEAARSAAEAARSARFRAVCAAHGGQVMNDWNADSATCYVNFRLELGVDLPVRGNGSWDAAAAARNRAGCQVPDVWHPREGVCEER
jgi:hypothetical protein